MFNANIKPIMPNGSALEVDFVVFPIFSNGRFYNYETLESVMLHMKFDTNWRSGYGEVV